MGLSRPLGLGVLAVVTALLAACAGTESGTTIPGGSDATDTATEQTDPNGSAESDPDDSPSLAPPVEDPLDPELLLSEPCDLLTEDQRDELDLIEYSSQLSATNDPECSWAESDDGHNKVSITALTTNENGLDDTYAQRDEMSYFEPTEINSYPAAIVADHGQPGDYGECQIVIGITDELAAYAFAHMDRDPEADDPCPAMQETIEPMIDTLQG